MNRELLEEIAEETVSKLQDGIGLNSYGCDLHHELWNTGLSYHRMLPS